MRVLAYRCSGNLHSLLQEAVDNRILLAYSLAILLAAAGGRRQGRGPRLPGERLRRAVHTEDAELAFRAGRRRANERLSVSEFRSYYEIASVLLLPPISTLVITGFARRRVVVPI